MSFSVVHHQPLPIHSSLQIHHPHPPKPTSQTRSKHSWIESLRSQTRSYSSHEAISTFIAMHANGILPDNFAFPAVLKAATSLLNLNLGAQIQANVIKLGYDTHPTVANTLLHMYGTRGNDIDKVFKVFDGMPQRDQVSWNSIINSMCKYEEWDLALEAFRLMGLDEVEPSSFTLVSVALACSNLGWRDGVRLGKQVHGYGLSRAVLSISWA